MKKLFCVVAVVCAILLAGCSAHLYQSSNENVAKTEVVLSGKNFRVIGMVEGIATATRILGIGGLSEKAVRSNAVAEMYKNAQLYGSQTIININVKQTELGLPPFYWKTTYSATGTIVEFVE
ncbi:MAG: hypothetical protein E7147_02395 [Rikenellaceae bacterium]|nr:hypothetical protein [Rikenellaceae bacterium]